MASSEVKFEGEPHYVDGYVPSSLDSPHSSLQRSITWIGMGFVLASIAFAGIFIFGLSTQIFNDQVNAQPNSSAFIIGGIIGVVICLVVGFSAIHAGRADYRAYKKRTGRLH